LNSAVLFFYIQNSSRKQKRNQFQVAFESSDEDFVSEMRAEIGYIRIHIDVFEEKY